MHHFNLSIILRYLRGRRGFTGVVTSFSVVGILLGVAALIVVMSVMAGFREELLSRILGVNGHAQVTLIGRDLQKYEDVADKLTLEKEILSARPYVIGQGMVVSGSRASGVLMRGVLMEDIPAILRDNTQKGGSVSKLSEPRTVAIGKGLAKSLGLNVGDPVTLMSPDGNRTIVGFIPRMLQARVVAIFDVGLHQFDSGVVYMNLKTAQSFFKLGQGVTALELRVAKPDSVHNLRKKIKDIAGPAALVRVWQDTNRQFFQALQVERVTMFIILSLIIVVAAFNVITGQIMLVNDKRSDIAILRTMGATRQNILNIFFFNGLLLGLLGTLGGLVLGMFILSNLQGIIGGIEWIFGIDIFASEIYFLSELPSKVVWADTFVVLCISMVITLFASLYPAWRASRLDPVEVLRYE